MLCEGELEHEAMIARVADLVRRWSLTAEEASRLFPDHDGQERERACRILLELDYVMRGLLSSEELADWLRDAGPGGISPLIFLASGASERSAMLAAARLRYRQIVGHHI